MEKRQKKNACTLNEEESCTQFTKVPKQYLDSKMKYPLKVEDVSCSRYTIAMIADSVFKPNGFNPQDVQVAIQGGLTGIDWTFEQEKIILAIFDLFSEQNYPDSINVNRSNLYKAMGEESYIDRKGKRRFYEGPNYVIRKKLTENLKTISIKSVPFIFSAKTGNTNNGRPKRTLAIEYAPILKAVPVYKNVAEPEYQKLINNDEKDDRPIKNRLSHYIIKINPNSRGEIGKYYRELPKQLAKKISDFRKSRNEKPTKYELNFIEYLFTKNKTPIEINYLKLAEKLKIKSLHDKKKVRGTLNRCYETAIALTYVTEIRKDVAKFHRGTKDIIHLNPAKFYKLAIKTGENVNVNR